MCLVESLTPPRRRNSLSLSLTCMQTVSSLREELLAKAAWGGWVLGREVWW